MKKSVTMITLLLLIVGMLSACGNDSNENRNVAQDVLLSYDYDSNGELSKITLSLGRADTRRHPRGVLEYPWEWKAEEFNVTYDESGYLKSIETKQYETGLAPDINSMKTNQDAGLPAVDLAIKADYNADGQIISLTAKYFVVGDSTRFTYNCEVVYNSDDIKVNISNQERDYNENRIYDTDYNLISAEWINSNDHVYIEYTNGILSHYYEYDVSTGQLLIESTYYDNGNKREHFEYDRETGDLKNHSRYDRNGELIN